MRRCWSGGIPSLSVRVSVDDAENSEAMRRTLDLGLHIVDGVRRLHLKGDSLTREGLDENLHDSGLWESVRGTGGAVRIYTHLDNPGCLP
jgi:hypothetical protein